MIAMPIDAIRIAASRAFIREWIFDVVERTASGFVRSKSTTTGNVKLKQL